MKRSPTVLLLAVAVILAGSALGRTAPFPQPADWPTVAVDAHAAETLGPGVTYDRWQLRAGNSPLIVHVTTVDLHNPSVALVATTHRDIIVGADEPLSAMADRARAQAAINADYFDINESGAPLNVLAVGGHFLHQPNGAAALVVGAGNAVSMGPVTLTVTLSSPGTGAAAGTSGAKLDVASINDWSKENGLALLTPEFGPSTPGADLEIVLTPDGTGTYRVANIGRSLDQLLLLKPGDLGVAARGAEQVGRLSAFGSNDVISVTYAGVPDPTTIVSAVGGGPLLLRDGKPANDLVVPAPQETQVRYPVTGAGLSADGGTLWLIAVDGRAPDRSVGITRPMLRSLLSALGAAQGMAFDSGGSTEMAIRHLGDTSVSVANTPSDGKERSIADALLVLNAASPGPAAQVVMRTAASAVLAGSHLQVRVSAIDANMQPVPLDPSTVSFSFDSACCATVDASGAVTATSVGTVNLLARSEKIGSQPLPLAVVKSVNVLAINGYSRGVPAGGSVRLTIDARTRDGRPIQVDPSAVMWSAKGGGGRIASDGTFVGASSASVATVTARAGGATSTLRVLVGEHAVVLPPSPWRFSASPATVSGAVDALAAPDGAAGLHLDYNFAQGGATRAAIAAAELPLPGEPLAVRVDVYGDGNGEWLRGAYRNADGIVDSVTIARHVDWTGWKTLRVALPPQVRWPVVWTRLYAVEPRRDAIEAGDLWFRNFSAIYAGPAPPVTLR